MTKTNPKPSSAYPKQKLQPTTTFSVLFAASNVHAFWGKFGVQVLALMAVDSFIRQDDRDNSIA
jgi:hypothetical protein